MGMLLFRKIFTSVICTEEGEALTVKDYQKFKRTVGKILFFGIALYAGFITLMIGAGNLYYMLK